MGVGNNSRMSIATLLLLNAVSMAMIPYAAFLWRERAI